MEMEGGERIGDGSGGEDRRWKWSRTPSVVRSADFFIAANVSTLTDVRTLQSSSLTIRRHAQYASEQ